MNLDSEMVLIATGIRRHHKIRQRPATMGSAIGSHHQIAVLVIAACGTYSLYKIPRIVIDCLKVVQILWLVPLGTSTHAVRSSQHLIIALKQELLIVVLEAIGNLRPQFLELGIVGRIVGSFRLDPGLRAGTRIVVDVQHTVHTIVENILHNRFNTVHPVFPYITVSIHLLEPGHRHTDSGKALLLEFLHQELLCDRLSPTGLVFVCRRPCGDI